MDQRCRREVIGLHQFFQNWFNGELEDSEAGFSRLRVALASGFQMISPEGRATDREHLIQAVRASHGGQRRRREPVRIWIEGYEGRPLTRDLHLATYQEWQSSNGRTRGRRSTAIFRKSDTAPNGVEWVHVHETWLADGEGDPER